MKIGIIGAGNIGGNLTRRLTALGHEVAVANSRGPETLTALAEETGATPVPVAEAARGAEIVVVTIPFKNVPDLPAGLFDGAAPGFVVIDTGNYYPRRRDGRIAGVEDEGLTESRWTERQLGQGLQRHLRPGHPRPAPPGRRPGPDRAARRGRRRDGEEGRTGPHRGTRLRLGRLGRPRRLLAAAARHPRLRTPRRCGGRHPGPRRGLPGPYRGVPRLTRTPCRPPSTLSAHVSRTCPAHAVRATGRSRAVRGNGRPRRCVFRGHTE